MSSDFTASTPLSRRLTAPMSTKVKLLQVKASTIGCVAASAITFAHKHLWRSPVGALLRIGPMHILQTLLHIKPQLGRDDVYSIDRQEDYDDNRGNFLVFKHPER